MAVKFARKLLLCAFGYVGVAYATPVELEVLGRIIVHTEVEPTADGKQIVEGRLTDEVGKPVAGVLSVSDAQGRKLTPEPCPWIEQPEGDGQPQTHRGVLTVGVDGEFCFLTNEEKGLVVRGSAEHFMDATHDLDIGAGRQLARPRFVQAPTTIDLHEPSSHIVEVLGRSERKPPDGARLALTLQCDKAYPLKDIPLADARLLRLELEPPQGIAPGACQFVATAAAPNQKPLSSTRSVEVRDAISLSIDGQMIDGDFALVRVAARGSKQGMPVGQLDEGLVEARENGAFVALAPVHRGEAELELETNPSDRQFTLTYVPASSSFVAGAPLLHSIPAREPGFRWAGIHTFALLLFAAWLGYAWLRPRGESRRLSEKAPPRRATVQETGKRSGPIEGTVRDAHTGAALGQVELVLLAVGTETTKEIERQHSKVNGGFTFETKLEDHTLLKLQAAHASYMSLQSATRSSHVSVHLTHRRRALVAHLVSWAKKAGRPWSRPKSPTPGSIEAVANAQDDELTADWARAVGQAAYAPGAPSEETVEGLREPGTMPGPEAP